MKYVNNFNNPGKGMYNINLPKNKSHLTFFPLFRGKVPISKVMKNLKSHLTVL